jgi:DNA-binding NtrC family response regulator
LPRLGGLAVLRRLRDTSQRVPIVIMTAYDKIKSAVQAMQLGAVDYIEKPIGMVKLRRQMREWFTMQEANPAESPAYRRIVGESPQIRGVWQLMKKFAPSDMTILLEGERGTG